MKNRKRCRIHGGLAFGPPPGSQNALKHGLYSSSFNEKEREIFERRLNQLLSDPRGALLADAAALMAKAEAVLESSKAENGMLVLEIEDTTGIGMTGQPVELKKTKRVNVLAPLGDVMTRAALVTGKAYEVDPKAGDEERELKRRKLAAETAVLEKEAAADGASKEPIEIIVREYKEPPEEGGGEST